MPVKTGDIGKIRFMEGTHMLILPEYAEQPDLRRPWRPSHCLFSYLNFYDVP